MNIYAYIRACKHECTHNIGHNRGIFPIFDLYLIHIHKDISAICAQKKASVIAGFVVLATALSYGLAYCFNHTLSMYCFVALS